MIHERKGKHYIVFVYKLEGRARRFYKRAANPDNLDQLANDAKKAAFYESKWRELIEQGTDPERVYAAHKNTSSAARVRTVGELIETVWPEERKAYRYPDRWPGFCLKRIKDEFGSKTFADVTPLVGRAWLRKLGNSLAARTVNRHKEAAQVVWRWAIQAGATNVNPWMNVPKAQELPTVKRILSRDAEARILEICDDPLWAKNRWHVKAAIIILVDHGLRPESEFFAMVKSQVNFEARTIEVISYKGGGGRMAKRIVPMTARSEPYFRRLVGEAKADRIFPYDSIRTSWHKLTDKAGVKGLWLRWLRDTAQNRWKEQGMHPEDIATLMGHSVALNQVYNRVDLNAARELMNKGQAVAKVLQFGTDQKERQAAKLA
jgi:site-specific recombinase XerD